MAKGHWAHILGSVLLGIEPASHAAANTREDGVNARLICMFRAVDSLIYLCCLHSLTTIISKGEIAVSIHTLIAFALVGGAPVTSGCAHRTLVTRSRGLLGLEEALFTRGTVVGTRLVLLAGWTAH